MSRERLQKVLARAGVASRRKSEELIRQGRVTVNGAPAELGQQVDPAGDAVKVDGKRIHPTPPDRYLLLNKPRGYVTTRSDPQGRPTVFELVPPRLRPGLVAVGRLDYQSEGLLVLTDDGDLAHRVAHPSFGCWKRYDVKVKGAPTPEALETLRQGIVLEGRRTAPARIRPRKMGKRRGEAKNTWWLVEIREGRTRQIREMFFRIGHPVQRLRRVGIGPVQDPRLPPGSYRELTAAEIRGLDPERKGSRSRRGGPGRGGRQ